MKKQTRRGTLHLALILLISLFLSQSSFAQFTFWTIGAQTKIADNLNGLPNVLDQGDFFGRAVANVGDIDGNGIDDLAVSAERDDDGGIDKGAIYILFIDAAGNVMGNQKISQTQGNFTGSLNSANNLFGASIAGVGDINMDGVPDIAVGDTGDDDGGTARGAVYILFMQPNGTVLTHQKISSTVGNLIGTLNNGDNFGRSLTLVGDLNGDGFNEIAVGAHHDDDGGMGKGAVYILSLDQNGKVAWEQKISELQGGFTGGLDVNDRFGAEAAGIGDLDGDGIPDLAVSAVLDDDGGTDRGAVYILFLKANGIVHHQSKISDTQGNFLGVLDNRDNFGIGLSAMPDLECDETNDIAIGAWRDDDGGTDKGAVWMVNLNSNGTVAGYWKIAEGLGGFAGPLSNSDRFGMSIANMGDINGDKFTDIAIGARHDDHGGTDQGAVWLLNGFGYPCTAKASEIGGPIENPVEVRVFDLTGRLLWKGDFENQRAIEYPEALPRNQILIYQYWEEEHLQVAGKMILD